MPASRPGLVDDDHGVAFDPARAGRQLGELPPGELGRLGIGLQLLMEVGLGLRLRAPALHDELAEREDGLAVEPALFRQAREGRAGEAFELLEVLEVLLLDGDLLLKPLGVGLELLDPLFLGADLLPRVVLDGAGPEPGAEHAEAFGPLGVERAVDGLRRQRGDDQLDGPIPLGDAHLAGHQRLALVHGHGHDLARCGSRRRDVLGRPSGVRLGVRRGRFHGRAELRRPARPPAIGRRSCFVLDEGLSGSEEAREPGSGACPVEETGRTSHRVYSMGRSRRHEYLKGKSRRNRDWIGIECFPCTTGSAILSRTCETRQASTGGDQGRRHGRA